MHAFIADGRLPATKLWQFHYEDQLHNHLVSLPTETCPTIDSFPFHHHNLGKYSSLARRSPPRANFTATSKWAMPLSHTSNRHTTDSSGEFDMQFATLCIASPPVFSGIGAFDSHGFMARTAEGRQRTWDSLHVSPRAVSKGAKLCASYHGFGRLSKVCCEPYHELRHGASGLGTVHGVTCIAH